MKLYLLLLLMSGCLEARERCSDGSLCPIDNVCDEIHHRCAQPSQLTVCAELAERAPCFVGSSEGACDQGVCMIDCNDGVRGGLEACDGTDITIGCTALGFYDMGTPACTSECKLDTSTCTGECDDGELDPEEEICEATIAPTRSCVDYGFGAGALGCQNCGPDTNECIEFGWKSVPLPTGGSARLLHGTDAENIFVAGTAGLLARFDGAAWSAAPTCTNFTSYTSLWTFAPGEAIVVHRDMALARVDATSCTDLIPPFTSIKSVYATSPTKIWAASASTTASEAGIWFFDGMTWTRQHSATRAISVWGTSDADIYATTTNAGVVHYDGTTWSPVTALGAGANGEIFGDGPNNIYVTGFDATGAQLAHFDGTTWQSVPVPGVTAQDNYDSGFVEGGRLYLSIFKFGSATSRLVVREGLSWHDLRSPFRTNESIWKVPGGPVLSAGLLPFIIELGTARLDGGGVGVQPYLVRLEAGSGRTLAIAETDLYEYRNELWEVTSFDVADVSISPLGNLFVVGTTGLRRQDGTTWTAPLPNSFAATSVSAVAADDAWIADGTMVRHWTTTGFLDYALPHPVQDLYAAGIGDDVWALDIQGTIHRFDLANQRFLPVMTEHLHALRGRAADDIYAFGIDLVVHWDGVAWSPIATPVTAGIIDVYANGGDDLFVSTGDVVLHYDGTRWSPVATGTIFGIATITGAGNTVFMLDGLGNSHRLVRATPW